jgi:TonB family protein
MTTLENWVLSYLVNAVWQVPLLFFGVWLAARMAARIGPGAEHRVWVGALLAQIALPACPLAPRQLWGVLSNLVFWGGPSHGGDIRVIVAPAPVTGSSALHLGWLVSTVLLAACAGGVCYYATRLAWGLLNTRHIVRKSAPLRLEGEHAACWTRSRTIFTSMLNDPAFTPALATSELIAGPVTVGSRTLLLPQGLLAQLPEDEFDALRAHEFAHMARRDFAKNLLYGLLSLPVAWHPALILTRARLAESRERVCDALAAEAVSGRQRYARSLLRLASIMSTAKPAGALHALGIFDSNNLERRIMNLTGKHTQIRGLRRLIVLAACAALGAAAGASALALRMEVNQQSHAANAPRHVDVKNLKIVYKVPPTYPPQAKADRLSGIVVLEAVIGKDGSVQDLKVVKSVREDLDQAAIDAVKQWKFEPVLLNGEPIEVKTTIQIHYSLKK